MSENFSRSVLRIVIAQLSQAVGFDTIQSSSLDILTDVIERYLSTVGKSIHNFSEQRGQSKPHLGDVDFAFRHLNISLADIVDYTKQMEPIEFAHNLAKFPAPKESNLRFPSGNNPEDFNREEHVPLYMPSMVAPPEKPTPEVQNTASASNGNQQGKKATFVIAGKHSQGFSSDDDDYSAGDVSNEEYMSDDSLAHNPIKSRHLTKPEDIPTIEGTAPSSLMSMPSSAELDELKGSMSPTRRTSFEGTENQFGREKKLSSQTPKFGAMKKPANKPSSQDLSWLTPDKPTQNKWKTPDSNQSRSRDQHSDPDWLSEKKKSQDVYDPGWLQDEGASPVHLTKPPTLIAPSGSSTEKRPWFSKNKDAPATETGSSKSTSKKLPGTKHKAEHSLSTPTQKQAQKPNAERKSAHHKPYKPGFKSTPLGKKEKGGLSDEPIKARIEAAERLLHSAPVPPYVPANPKSIERRPGSRPSQKSPVRSSIERAEKLLKYPPVENLAFPSSRESSPSVSKRETTSERSGDDKEDRSNFASSKSMYDAIDAVINRASEETVRLDEQARKEAEEADLMKFSHLVESSSSDSEPDVSHKAEQMLQLQERGLQKDHPPTPESPPSGGESPPSLGIDEEDEDVTVDSDSGDSVKLPPKKSYDNGGGGTKMKVKLQSQGKKDKHKKKMKQKVDDSYNKSPQRSHSTPKPKKEKHNQKPSSFVTTETIAEKPVKMKVKLKHFEHKEPKLFDVSEDRDRIKILVSKPSKENKQKSKEGKHHKVKEHKKHTPKLSVESKQSSGDQDMPVEKIILKKSKSGDAKVVKPKVKEHHRSPSPPSPVASRSNLPLPKLSAAVSVSSISSTSREKEKKKSKKEKKKKKDKDKERDLEREWSYDKEKPRKESKDKSHLKEKYRDTDWNSPSRRDSFDSDVSSPLVPKLTLKMGASEKKFVIKPSSMPSTAPKPTSSKKRSHSSVDDSPVPAKDRKVSVESVKMVSGGFAAAVERKVVTQTISAGPVGVYEDADGNKVWICPGCNKPDDGSPMIGCDTCDDWYHWPCVGIVKEPPDDQDWYCPRCIKKQQLAKAKGSTKKRKKK